MRTRLDEIVEEEWGVPGDDGRIPPTLLHIAKRAFRHGVERAIKAAFRPDCIEENVQPASAGEKLPGCHCGTRVPLFCDCGTGKFGTPDRRKGQRRHAQLYVRAAPYGQPQDDGWWEKYPPQDRRSGKERRKP